VILGLIFSFYWTGSLEHKLTIFIESERVRKSSEDFTQKRIFMLLSLIFIPKNENPTSEQVKSMCRKNSFKWEIILIKVRPHSET
jgi:hypothetical protein